MLKFIHELIIGDYLIDNVNNYHKITGCRDKYILLESPIGRCYDNHCVIMNAPLIRNIKIDNDDTISIRECAIEDIGHNNIIGYKKKDFFKELKGERVNIENHLDDYFIEYSTKYMIPTNDDFRGNYIFSGRDIKDTDLRYPNTVYIMCDIKKSSVKKTIQLNKYPYVSDIRTGIGRITLKDRHSFNLKNQIDSDLDNYYEDEKLPEYFFFDYKIINKHL